jgi:hypothetical protein
MYTTNWGWILRDGVGFLNVGFIGLNKDFRGFNEIKYILLGPRFS